MEISFGFGAAGLFLAIAWYYVAKLKHDESPLDALERLAQLNEREIIDDEEFHKLKEKYLKRID